MSNIFLSYRFTGEDSKELEEILTNIRDSLQSAGHSVFCSFWLDNIFRGKNFTTEQIYEYGLQKVDESEVFLAFVKSAYPSKGMNIESERAIEKNKRYILVIKEGLEFPEFRYAAHQVIEYEQLDNLYSKLKNIQ
ncbi:MAG: toll/interleukin-1 receptor domain-containing protein [Nanoarchaeota archaeon]|nr:toll/interleukin-1 receptor domain-containing protein [Nanoarchaeota archaeon]MBU1135857.1 toll/interleukin-1 receptor domain-containing protein [Nanoarchaeota archaeon]MBU2519829.1 toll/interleukin-1 receptor domain-containing protein [Nanoarchaeota archaeon]